MMRKTRDVKRSSLNNNILMLDEFGIQTLISKDEVLKLIGVDGIIRIVEKDYDKFQEGQLKFTHFNLEQSGHKEGKLYVLSKIIRGGNYWKDGSEILPVLDFDDCFIARCVAVKNNVAYDDLLKDIFENSFSHIKNVKSLKEKIVERYSRSLPDYSKDELLSFGVGITELELIGMFDGKKVVLFEKPAFEDKKKSGSIREGVVKNFVNSFGTISERSLGSIRNGFSQGLLEAAENDENVVALCADLTESLKIDKFREKYPKKFFEMGIAEQNMAGVAAGMCLNGKVPFIASYAVFSPGRNWDQIRVSICYSKHNVKIVGGHAGLTTGPDGATHQALEDIAMMRVLPNMCVIVPCDEEEARKATIAAAKYVGPVYLRLSREKSVKITDEKSSFEIGKANVLKKGDDVTIVACGLGVQFALDAAKKLEEDGVKAAVLNMHTIKPLDEKTLFDLVKKSGCVVSVEEHQVAGGLGSAVCEVLARKMPVPVEVVGVEDSFGESGEGYELLAKYGISAENIIAKVKAVMKRKKLLKRDL